MMTGSVTFPVPFQDDHTNSSSATTVNSGNRVNEGSRTHLQKLNLINQFEVGCEKVTDACFLESPTQKSLSIVTISTDRSVRVWLLRDSGQYWPSVCEYLTSGCTCITTSQSHRDYSSESQTDSVSANKGAKSLVHLFVGLETGVVVHFQLSRDFNSVERVRDYYAHNSVRGEGSSRVQGLILTPSNLLISVGRDKYIQIHCTKTGQRLCGFLCSSSGNPCTSIAYDFAAKYLFVGSDSGQISTCNVVVSGGRADGGSPSLQHVSTFSALRGNGPKSTTSTLTGAGSSVSCLLWYETRGWLFSGHDDSSIYVWDVGGRSGRVFELHAYSMTCPISGLSLCRSNDGRLNSLLSFSSSHETMVVWDMTVKRDQVTEWNQSDVCELCSRPFFWNLKAMYEQKVVGLRQHHCRKCGKAVCDSCSSKRSVLPLKGHEVSVRVCETCYINISESETKPLAQLFDVGPSNILSIDHHHRQSLLLTVGHSDRIIRIWNLANLTST